MNSDTVKLLKSCSVGCRYASDSMEHILPFVKNKSLKNSIETNTIKHVNYSEALCGMLEESGKTMGDVAALPIMVFRIKTDIKLGLSASPRRVASVMVERCEDGIKSVCKALKNCPKADKQSVELAKKIIKTEQDFLKDLIEYY